MDSATRTRYKQLANDSIIATFGDGSREQQLAEALEKAVDHIEYLRSVWRPVCLDCGERLQTYDEAEEDGAV